MDEEEWDRMIAHLESCIKALEDKKPSKSEQARYAQEMYKAAEMEIEDWSKLDQDPDPYPDPAWVAGMEPSPEIYYRPPIYDSPPASPPRPLPASPPRPIACFRNIKPLLLDEEILEEKTCDGRRQHNRGSVVSKRKMKRARNMDKKRK